MMNFSDIESKINTAFTGSDFTFSASGTEYESITTLLTGFFPNGELTLSNASQQSGASEITVQGYLTQDPTGIPNIYNTSVPPRATAVFTVENGLAQVNIRITGLPSGWKLSSTYTMLANSVFDNFDYVSPTLLLDSRNQAPLPNNHAESFGFPANTDTTKAKITGGLKFEADMNLRTGVTIDSLNWFLSANQWHFTGDIDLVVETARVIPAIHLETSLHSPFSLGGFQIPFILKLAGVILEPYDTSNPLGAGTCIQLEADIEKDIGSSQPLQIPVYLRQYRNNPSLAFIRSDLSAPSELLLDQVSKLLDNNAVNGLIPDLLPSLDNIHLENIELVVVPNSQQLLSTSATISYKNDDGWPIFGDVIVFNGMAVTFSYNPSGSKLSAHATAQATVSGGILDASLNLPELTFACELEEDTSIDIKQMVQQVIGDSVSMPNINCTQLKIFGDIKNKHYRFQAAVTDDWYFHAGNTSLGLTEIMMDLDYTAGPPSSISGQIAGVFTIKEETDEEIYVTVAANYDSEGDGWTFFGSTGPGQQIPIGTLLTSIATKFGVDATLPEAVSGLTFSNLHLSINSKSRDFVFTGEAKFPVDDNKEVDVILTIELLHSDDGNYTKHFAGHITFGGLEFDLVFDKDNTSTTFIAAYHQDGGNTVNVKTLMNGISTTIAENVPDSLEITLIDALMAYNQSTTSDKKFLFELDMSGGIDLTQLPLVGKFFTADQALKLTLQALATSKDFTQDNVTTINGLIPEGVTTLPDAAITTRLKLRGNMNIGGLTRELELPLAVNDDSATNATQPLKQTAAASDSVKWIKLQKNFGPLHIERVGVSYKDSNLWFLLDASLAVGGLDLSLEGLSVHSPLNTFHPVFGLNGLGIDYSSGPIEIGGAFLRTEVTRDGETYTEYDGTAIVRAKAITLSAIGSYAQYQGQTSLFIYAVLNMPLGGPAFFFVEGLAGGFGYNRSFILPPIDQIAPFPLVQEAMGKAPGAATTANLADELSKIRDYIPPDVGEYFIAVGLKYNSFKLVDAFALLSVSFGKHFEIDILGLSRIVVPPMVNKSPLAVVEMALSARFAPDEGILSIRAQLTNASYLLSPNCHLTGGFAFCTWFNPNEHAGDFVITLGGYHPHFKVPVHYPKVPRLGFNWQVTDKLSLKGDAYFALCSHAFMAGGHLEALYHDGALRAWFKAGADFLVEWKPYHYEASIYVDLGASYTFHFFGTHHITIDVGADLELWGPKFAGKAKIHIWIITVTVHFGSSSRKPQAIDWATFKSSFLPANDKVCSTAAGDGLTRTIKSTESFDGNERWLVSPKHFTLAVNTAIPIKDAYKRAVDTTNAISIDETKGIFGIGSMDIGLDQVDSRFTVFIGKIAADGTRIAAESEFNYTPIKKKVPAGMWGGELVVDVNGTTFIDNAVCGFEITPKAVPTAGETDDVERRDLSYSTTSVSNAFTCTGIISKPADTTADDAARRSRIRSTIVSVVDPATGKSTRDSLLEALDIDPTAVRVGAATADDYLIPPRILGQAA